MAMKQNTSGKIPFFESDDVEEKMPEAAVMPPRSSPKSEDIYVNPTKPHMAFEFFAGKIYDTSTANLGDSIKIRELSSDREFFSAGPIRKKEVMFQSPLQRFTQLKSEVESFTKDLEALSKELKESKDPSKSMPLEATRMLTKEIITIKNRLSSLEKDEEQKRLLQTTFPIDSSIIRQQAMTTQMTTQLAQLTDSKIKKASESSSASVPPGKIQYELYYQAGQDSASLSGLSALDQRVANLEKLIGQQKNVIGVRYPDIHSAVHYLKKRLELLDKSKLDSISNRIKKLLTDLIRLQEALHKAQTPKTAPSATGSGADAKKNSGLPTKEEILNHYQKVHTVHEMLSRYQETANQLPTVIDRLKSLRSLHEHTATAMSRLNRLEQQQVTLDTILKQNQEMLSRVEKSFETNMKQMLNNTKVLEEKFAKISKGRK